MSQFAPHHKSSASLLALIYTALIVYASLYPFTNWREFSNVMPFAFLPAPLSRYWTKFDVISNVLGYIPLGFFLALSGLRTEKRFPFWTALLSGSMLSLTMESLQSYLPMRVPSNLDLGLNITGTFLGAFAALWLEKKGALDRWSRWRARWFVDDARITLVLLALWPVALLFPSATPLGSGQILQRFSTMLQSWFAGSIQDSIDAPIDTPSHWLLSLLDSANWLPLSDAGSLFGVIFGGLAPIFLGFSITRSKSKRFVLMLFMLCLGVFTTALSAALSWGPQHAWNWLTGSTKTALFFALFFACFALPLRRRGCTAICILALTIQMCLLNFSSTSAFFAQALQTWEQGRFIRFHGLAQWIGWLWPYAVLLYLIARLSQRTTYSTLESRFFR